MKINKYRLLSSHFAKVTPLLLLLCLCSTSLFGQKEYNVNTLGQLIEALSQESENYTFSYPTELIDTKGASTLIQLPASKERVINWFNKYNCEVQFIGNNHILLRSNLAIEENYSILTVIDQKTKEPLPWTAITYALPNGKETVSFTNDEGKVTLPSGILNATISQLGYKAVHLNLVPQKQQIIRLQADPVSIKEIEKSSFQPAIKKSVVEGIAQNYSSPYMLKGFGVSGPDVIASVQGLPGVNSADESASQVKIRGSAADATHIVMDGIPLIQQGHYFDLVGAINPLYVQRYTLYKNAIPTDKASTSGGLLMLDSNPNRTSEAKAQAEVNFVAANVHVYAPLSNKVSINIAGRHTLQDISNNGFYSLGNYIPPIKTENLVATKTKENIIKSSPTFGFYDGNMKLDINLTKTKLYLSAFSFNDDFSNVITQQQEFGFGNFSKNIITAKYNNERNWSSNGIGSGISHQWSPNNKTVVAAHSTVYEDDYSLKGQFATKNEFKTTSNSNLFNMLTSNTGLNLKQEIGNEERRQLTIGYDAQYYNNEAILLNSRNPTFTKSNSGTIHAFFTSLSGKQGALKYSVGQRTTYTAYDPKTYIDPQANLFYTVNDKVLLKGSVYSAHQLQRRIQVRDLFDQSLGIWTLSGADSPVLRSDVIMLGSTLQKGAFYFDVEAYLKGMNGVAEYANPRPALRDEDNSNQLLQLMSGKGIAKGIDFMARYERQGFSSQLAYTLSSVRYTIPQIFRGLSYPSEQDRTHQLKWMNLLKVGGFDLQLNHNYATGQAYLSGNISDDEELKKLNSVDFLKRLPDYSRTDLSLGYRTKLNKLDVSLKTSVTNLFNHENVRMVQYLSVVRDLRQRDVGIITGTNTSLLYRTLNLSVHIGI